MLPKYKVDDRVVIKKNLAGVHDMVYGMHYYAGMATIVTKCLGKPDTYPTYAYLLADTGNYIWAEEALVAINTSSAHLQYVASQINNMLISFQGLPNDTDEHTKHVYNTLAELYEYIANLEGGVPDA